MSAKASVGKCFTVSNKGGIARQLISSAKVASTLVKDAPLEVNALWDTGATGSVITPNVAKKLGLSVVSQVFISTPTDRNKAANMYYVDIHLPNKVIVSNISVIEGIPANCDILIGMDIIGFGDFAVSCGGGKTIFSFRVPSMMEIDFCKESYL
jgi:predicted aspartyl protease